MSLEGSLAGCRIPCRPISPFKHPSLICRVNRLNIRASSGTRSELLAATRMKTYRLADLHSTEIHNLKSRPRIDFSSMFGVVGPIIEDVRKRGDAAIIDYTTKFDGVNLDKVVECVADLPDPKLDPAVQAAFDVAYDNIRAFHAAQRNPEQVIENMKGVRCKRVARSIDSVGLYVPGGTAVLPSTALMLAVPAQLAGCRIIILASPPCQMVPFARKCFIVQRKQV